MKKIFKYPIPVSDYFHTPLCDKFKIPMPEFAKVLCVQTQKGKPHIWALIDDTDRLRDRDFRIIPTGQQIVEDNDQLDFVDYVGTFQSLDGSLIWHLFDFYYDENS